MNTLAIALTFSLSFATFSVSEAQETPRLPYKDWGACPFECCTYREWVAEAPIAIYKHRNQKSPILYRLKQGEHVQAITGVVVTHKLGRTQISKPLELGYLPNGTKPMLSLKPGAVVYPLHYAGEGYDVFWFKGKVYSDQISVPENGLGQVPNADTVKVLSRPEYVWWAKIKNKAGQTGWTKETDKFGNQDACG